MRGMLAAAVCVGKKSPFLYLFIHSLALTPLLCVAATTMGRGPTHEAQLTSTTYWCDCVCTTLEAFCLFFCIPPTLSSASPLLCASPFMCCISLLLFTAVCFVSIRVCVPGSVAVGAASRPCTLPALGLAALVLTAGIALWRTSRREPAACWVEVGAWGHLRPTDDPQWPLLLLARATLFLLLQKEDFFFFFTWKKLAVSLRHSISSGASVFFPFDLVDIPPSSPWGRCWMDVQMFSLRDGATHVWTFLRDWIVFCFFFLLGWTWNSVIAHTYCTMVQIPPTFLPQLVFGPHLINCTKLWKRGGEHCPRAGNWQLTRSLCFFIQCQSRRKFVPFLFFPRLDWTLCWCCHVALKPPELPWNCYQRCRANVV